MSVATIGIVDYGMGNRRSVEKALEHVGAHTIVSDDHDALRGAEGLVLPGVGAFPHGMANLRRLGLDELLRERFAAGVPLLGICLGMQLPFSGSDENGGADGLGLVDGQVRRLPAAKLPHIGWNEVEFMREDPLIARLPRRCAFYHVHSYAPVCDDGVLGTCEYEGAKFASAYRHGSFWGVQFHPEKSSQSGLELLRGFAAICRAPAQAAA